MAKGAGLAKLPELSLDKFGGKDVLQDAGPGTAQYQITQNYCTRTA